MRLHLSSLSFFFLVACGGGSSEQSTLPAEPTEPATPAEAVPAAETPAQPPVEAPAAPLPDAPTAGPDIYKTIFENEKVRVFEVTFAPGAKIAAHHHPAHAVYALTDGSLRLFPPKGAPVDVPLKAGDAFYDVAQDHAAENTTDKEIKAVLVELKPDAQFSAVPAGDDPLKVGPKLYKQVYDNPRVRILTVEFAKGASIKPHVHPDHVAYVTSAGTIKLTPAGGKATNVDFVAGQAMMLPAGVHSAKWVKGHGKAVIFEIKPADDAAPSE